MDIPLRAGSNDFHLEVELLTKNRMDDTEREFNLFKSLATTTRHFDDGLDIDVSGHQNDREDRLYSSEILRP